MNHFLATCMVAKLPTNPNPVKNSHFFKRGNGEWYIFPSHGASGHVKCKSHIVFVSNVGGCRLQCFGLQILTPNTLQGGPLQVINRVVTPINGLINGFAWSYNPTYRSYFTPFITPSGSEVSTICIHLR